MGLRQRLPWIIWGSISSQSPYKREGRRQRGLSQKNRMGRCKQRLKLAMEEGDCVPRYVAPLEAGKGKKYSTLEPPERATLLMLIFKLVRLISDFRSPELRDNKYVLSY